MKLKLLLFFLVNFCFTEMYAQIQKVGLAVDLSNGNTKSALSGLYNNSTASLGVVLKMDNSNLRIYGSYLYSTYILTPLGLDEITIAKSHSIQSQFLGGTIEYFFLNESKTIQPFLRGSLLSEFKSNYENGFVGYKTFIPLNFESPPLTTNYAAVYYGDYSEEQMFGCAFYKSTPIILSVNGGVSFRLLENFRVNLSAGYSLSMMKYKYVKWTQYDDFNEMMDRSPMQKKALHSIAGQVGLNYVFLFRKEEVKIIK